MNSHVEFLSDYSSVHWNGIKLMSSCSKKVSYRRSRISTWTVVDREKFFLSLIVVQTLIVVSYVRACRSQKLWGRSRARPWGANTRETRYCPHVLTPNFVALGQTVWAHRGPKDRGSWGPPLGVGCGWYPRNTQRPHMYYHTKFHRSLYIGKQWSNCKIRARGTLSPSIPFPLPPLSFSLPVLSPPSPPYPNWYKIHQKLRFWILRSAVAPSDAA